MNVKDEDLIELPCGCSIKSPCKTAKLLYKRLSRARYVSMSPTNNLAKKTPRKSKLYLHLEHNYMIFIFGVNYANKELNIS